MGAGVSSEVRGRSVVVTGASSGIGVATARAFGAAGARVTLAARREDRLHALAEELGAAGVQVLVARTDMRVEEQVVSLIARARERFGGVDVLVNNAGLGRAAPLSSGSTAHWREMLEVNVLGLSIATREAVSDMERRGVAGHVVHVSSMAGHRIPGTASGMYAASKFAARAPEPDPGERHLAGLRRHRVLGGLRGRSRCARRPDAPPEGARAGRRGGGDPLDRRAAAARRGARRA